MNEQVKQHTVKALEFLKNHQHIDNLTLVQIQERMIEYEGLLIEFVEKVLEDKEDENGTMTTWWLFDNVDKVLFTEDAYDKLNPAHFNVESPEDFVTYMLERNDNETIG